MKDLSVHRHKSYPFRQETGKILTGKAYRLFLVEAARKDMPFGQSIAASWKGGGKRRTDKRRMRCIGVAVSIRRRYEGRKGKEKNDRNLSYRQSGRGGFVRVSAFYKRIWRSQKKKTEVVKRITKGKTGAIVPGR